MIDAQNHTVNGIGSVFRQNHFRINNGTCKSGHTSCQFPQLRTAWVLAETEAHTHRTSESEIQLPFVTDYTSRQE